LCGHHGRSAIRPASESRCVFLYAGRMIEHESNARAGWYLRVRPRPALLKVRPHRGPVWVPCGRPIATCRWRRPRVCVPRINVHLRCLLCLSGAQRSIVGCGQPPTAIARLQPDPIARIWAISSRNLSARQAQTGDSHSADRDPGVVFHKPLWRRRGRLRQRQGHVERGAGALWRRPLLRDGHRVEPVWAPSSEMRRQSRSRCTRGKEPARQRSQPMHDQAGLSQPERIPRENCSGTANLEVGLLDRLDKDRTGGANFIGKHIRRKNVSDSRLQLGNTGSPTWRIRRNAGTRYLSRGAGWVGAVGSRLGTFGWRRVLGG
jgi:hypothetical protein